MNRSSRFIRGSERWRKTNKTSIGVARHRPGSPRRPTRERHTGLNLAGRTLGRLQHTLIYPEGVAQRTPLPRGSQFLLNPYRVPRRFFGADLMKSVARRISDRHLLHLLKMWLEAPVEETDEQGRKRRTTRNKDEGRGTPQGGVASPLLANLYMRRFVVGRRIRSRFWGTRLHVTTRLGRASPI